MRTRDAHVRVVVGVMCAQVDAESQRVFQLLDKDASGGVSWDEFQLVVSLQPMVVRFFQLASGQGGDGGGGGGGGGDLDDDSSYDDLPSVGHGSVRYSQPSTPRHASSGFHGAPNSGRSVEDV